MPSMFSTKLVGRHVLPRQPQMSLCRPLFGQKPRRINTITANAVPDEEQERDWDQEMMLFKKRTMKPSQLEALRKLEEQKVDVGRVLYCKDSIAIVEGLNNDADEGTALSFSSGAIGTMLWRRSDNLVFALLCGGADRVSVGDGVECRVKGILQVVDESEGPSTKREYQLTSVPVGPELLGQVVDFLGRPFTRAPTSKASDGSGKKQKLPPPVRSEKQLPMLNTQPDMDSREQINECLFTGVKSVDVLTPLGRGQALQVSGPQGSGKTQVLIDAVLGQRHSDVRCVFAAVGCTLDELQNTLESLSAHGAMEYTTVVVCTEDRPLGEQYAALLTACSIAEEHRDAGGHSLVVLNDVSPLVNMWESITIALADLGQSVLESDRNDVAQLQEVSSVDTTPIPSSSIDSTVDESVDLSSSSQQGDSEEDEEGMVMYEGMLVSVAAAQRRRFFSSLIQRAAKMHRRLGGGSMTSLLVVPGMPARGEARKAREKILAYKHLSEAQKEKLLKAVEAKEQVSSNSQEKPGPRELRTEVVEEFMSICDGQVVLLRGRDESTTGYIVDPQLSVSRIGTRAYPAALSTLAPQVRLDLAQAVDAERYASDTDDNAAVRAKKRAAAVRAALPQPPRTFCSLSEQVVHLIALEKGLLDDVDGTRVQQRLAELMAVVRKECRKSLKEIEDSRQLTATAEQSISDVLEFACKQSLLSPTSSSS